MTTIARRPGTEVRSWEEKQEAALLAAFRRQTPKGQHTLLRQAKAIVAKEEWQVLHALKK